MKKLYTGINTPGYKQVRFTLDWRCPACGSEDVSVVERPGLAELLCDGGPSTLDEMQSWTCNSCGTQTPGRQMQISKEVLELTEAQKDEERKYYQFRAQGYLT
jgi:hypothetical protein